MENSKKGEKYTCKLCEYKTNRKVDMEAHIMSEHKGQIEADKKTEKDKIDTQTDKDSKKAKKTFSTWWLFAGLILAYIAGYTVNIIASVSGFPLIATIVSLAIFVFVCVYILAEGIAKDKPAYRSLAIGLLGIIVGLIAQHFIKDIKKFDTNKYRNAFIISWLVSTILIVIAVLAVSVLYAKYSPVQLIQPNTVKSIPQNYFYSIEVIAYKKVTLNCSFFSTNPVYTYIMTTSQFANFKNNSQQLDYLYSTGSTTLSTLDYTVNNGTYYIVISNTGANEANVDFQNCLLNV